jgi:hypothetical protein
MHSPSLVTFVLDRDSGDSLFQLAQEGPVWAVNSPANSDAASKARAAGSSITLLFVNGKTSEEWFLKHLDSVDQHHNEYSQKPGYSVLKVIGMPLTPRIEAYLPEFGFIKCELTQEGFNAYKR